MYLTDALDIGHHLSYFAILLCGVIQPRACYQPHMWLILLNYQPSTAPSVFLFPNNNDGFIFNLDQLIQKELPFEHSLAADLTRSIHFLVF